jgi:hypothetical protein
MNMGPKDENFNNHPKKGPQPDFWNLRILTFTPISIQKENSESALRTYATWLVRATRRKMAVYEPENTPKKSPN